MFDVLQQWNFIMLPLNILHTLIYFEMQKERPVRLVIGFALVPLPIILRAVMQTSGSETVMTLATVSVLAYIAVIFKIFIVKGNFSEVLFVVFSVRVLTSLVLTPVALVMIYLLKLSPTYDNYATASAIQAILCLALLLFFYRYVRKPGRRMLDSVRERAWYVSSLTPIFFTLLVSVVNSFVFFRQADTAFAFFALVTIAASVSAYLLLYTSVTGKSKLELLTAQLATTEKLAMAYRHYDAEIAARVHKIAILRHDLRQTLIQSNITPDVMNDDTQSAIVCENKMVGAMVSYYFAEAIKNGTHCETQLFVPAKLNIIYEKTYLIALIPAFLTCVSDSLR